MALCLIALLLILPRTSIPTDATDLVDSSKSRSWKEEHVAESIGVEEFLMESEATQRFLEDSPTIPYRNIEKMPFCKEGIYGNCLAPNQAKGRNNKHCVYYNRCRG
uniref:Uncharacterized protein n=1 Tax=Rhizophora mucronata TaxID=61149 RepID=A0A2P2LU56_RHIMU